MLNFLKKLSQDKLNPQSRLSNSANPVNILSQTKENIDMIHGDKGRLNLVLSAIQDSIIALDSQGKIAMFNLASEKLTGATTQEVLGKSIDQVIKVYENEKELSKDIYCSLNKANSEGAVWFRKELKIISLKNKIVFANLTSSQVKEGQDINLSYILTLHDVTEEKNFEAMKLDFVSMAAHELRTPLTSIKGYLSVFMNENKIKFDPDQNMFLTRISISAEQLLDLVENLLNVSKIERGIFNVNTASTNWVEVIQQIFDQFVERAKEKNLEFTFIKPEGVLPNIMVDKLRISEVISNLLSNSIAYTPPGGKIKIWVELPPDKSSIITHVQDNGEGIPEEAIPHLFTKFFRVSGKLEQGSKGTGLGLYISKAIMEMHHGKIWVESKIGKGSIFSFSLPLRTN